MEFRENAAIYLQITDFVCEQILLKKWPAGEKILSIRELAILMQVNPNTVQKSYDYLQQNGIITMKRGVGYFIEPTALKQILSLKRDRFLQSELPHLFKNMYLLKIDLKDIKKLYDQYIQQHFKS